MAPITSLFVAPQSAPLIPSQVMFVVLNLACATLELMAVPNFRPVFRLYSWRGALLGALICLVAMFAISPLNAGVTVLIVTVLFVYLSFAVTNDDKRSAEWGEPSR